MVTSITIALDNLYTTTWQNRQEGVADNIFTSTPFWFWMKDKGRMKSQRGGRIIEENLEYATNPNIQWITRGGTVPISDFQFLTVAQYNWRYLTGSIVRYGVDDQQNAGKNQIISWMNSKLDNTEASLGTEMETRLCGASGSAVNAFDGLQFLCADDPTTGNIAGSGTGVVGGIDQSAAANSWWRNQTKNMTALSFAAQGIGQMRTMLHNCMNNRRMDMPDILLTDQTNYEYYEDNVLGHWRATDTKLADAGFNNQTFKGIPMVWSPSISQRMYFLNTRFLTLIYDPSMYFDMTEWKPIPDQVNDRAAQIVAAMVLVTNRRRVQGVMFNMNTQ